MHRILLVLVNLAFVMKTQMVNKEGLAFQSAGRHEGEKKRGLGFQSADTSTRKCHFWFFDHAWPYSECVVLSDIVFLGRCYFFFPRQHF